jgi:signal peptidase I
MPGPESDTEPERQPRSRLRRGWRGRLSPRVAGLLEIAITLIIALALAEGVQAEIVKPFKIPSGSMEPTLKVGQRVLVNRLVYDFGKPHRGDVIVFHPPNSLNCAVSLRSGEPCPKGSEKPAGEYFVKRVMGLPGDRISIHEGHPVINGHELTDEPYITPCGMSGECNMPHPITVPAGHYFMMGDNRGDSDDSRFWGPIPERWIVGKVFFTYWPLNRLG